MEKIETTAKEERSLAARSGVRNGISAIVHRADVPQ